MGNAATLNNSRTVWTKLVNDAKRRKCFRNADDDNNLALAIEDAMRELELVDETESPFKLLSVRDKSETAATTSR